MNHVYPHHVRLLQPAPVTASHRNVWSSRVQMLCVVCIGIVSFGSFHWAIAIPVSKGVAISLPPSRSMTHSSLQSLPPIPQLPAIDLTPPPLSGLPAISGQVILLSLTQQWLWAYQDHTLVYAAPIATGRPEIPTPTGIYHVEQKVHNLTFTSAYPPSSSLYYTPQHVNYALYFRATGFYIHDASWRQTFGPGANVPHRLPNGTTETGSHGCVNLFPPVAQWLFHWATVGTTVVIVN